MKLLERVLAGWLGRFAEDRIFTEVQGWFRSGRSCSDQWLVLRYICEVWKRERSIHIWPSWILIKLMTVCGERNCGIRFGNME